jgi:hypothetical protein
MGNETEKGINTVILPNSCDLTNEYSTAYEHTLWQTRGEKEFFNSLMWFSQACLFWSRH